MTSADTVACTEYEIDDISYRDAQKLCKERGLSAKGYDHRRREDACYNLIFVHLFSNLLFYRKLSDLKARLQADTGMFSSAATAGDDVVRWTTESKTMLPIMFWDASIRFVYLSPWHLHLYSLTRLMLSFTTRCSALFDRTKDIPVPF
jgi:hypothetical protein